MERNGELKIKLTEEVIKALGITEESFFEASFVDGHLYVTVVELSGVDTAQEDEEETDGDYIDCATQDCRICEYSCPHCGKCIIDVDEESEDDYDDEND